MYMIKLHLTSFLKALQATPCSIIIIIEIKVTASVKWIKHKQKQTFNYQSADLPQVFRKQTAD